MNSQRLLRGAGGGWAVCNRPGAAVSLFKFAIVKMFVFA